eukprot:5001511-Ditylum_brightwellii.AAC.1
MLTVFEEIYEYLTSRGFKPQLNIMDNEASKKVKKAILKTQAKYQLVTPHNHRVNTAERAMHTFKNHFIAGLCSTNLNFPLYLWDLLIQQATLTLNLLHQSRLNPTVLAEHILNGPHDFNKVPLAPPGTRAVIFDDPESQASWDPHGTDAWYVEPAPEHYQNYTFYIPATCSTHITNTAEFFPIYTKMP